MFTHNLIESSLPSLSTRLLRNKRHYLVNGGLYPSVTTVIGHRKADFFAEWRKTVTPEEAAYGANRGTWLHTTVEKYLRNDDDIFVHRKSEVISEVIGKRLFNQVKPFLDEHIGVIRAIEPALYSDVLTMAGRTDLVAEYKGPLSIVDFKTSKTKKRVDWLEDYFLQVTAYSIMWTELTKIPIKQGVVLITAEDNTCEEHIVNTEDYEERLAEVILEYFHDVHGAQLKALV